MRGFPSPSVTPDCTDITALRRLLPIFQDPHAFSICKQIPQAPAQACQPATHHLLSSAFIGLLLLLQIPSAFVEYFGDHRPIHFDNALMLVQQEEPDEGQPDASQPQSRWDPVFLFLFGTAMAVSTGLCRD